MSTTADCYHCGSALFGVNVGDEIHCPKCGGYFKVTWVEAREQWLSNLIGQMSSRKNQDSTGSLADNSEEAIRVFTSSEYSARAVSPNNTL